MLIAYLAASSIAVSLSLAVVLLSAAGGADHLLLRVIGAVVVVDQATFTVLAIRVPSMARFRPVGLALGAIVVAGGAGVIAWGAFHEPGTMRWLLAALGMALVAQGLLAFRVTREADSGRAGDPRRG